MIHARGIEILRPAADGRALCVLDGVDLTVARGEILGLIGPPSAGKSTLLKAIAGLVPLARGGLSVDGSAIDLADPVACRRWQQRIGMAFQNDALFDGMSVFANVAFPLRRRRLDEAEVARRVQARLADVDLAGAGAKRPAEISGGMRKRAGIARATVIEPELGLFDDPIAGLDPTTGALILDLIVRMTESLNMATVIVSNDLPVLLPCCRRVMMLCAGTVLYAGEPDGLLTSPRPEVVQFATGSDAGPL